MLDSRRRYFKVPVVALLLMILPAGIALLTHAGVSVLVMLAPALVLCGAFLAVLSPYSLLALVLIPLTVLEATTVLSYYRVSIAGFPVGTIDIGYALVAVSLLVALLRKRWSGAKSGGLQLPSALVAFVGVTLVSLLWGVVNANPTYQMVRAIRYPFSLVLFYLATIHVVHNVSQVRNLLRVLVVGTSLAALQNIFMFVHLSPLYLTTNSLPVLRALAFPTLFYTMVFLSVLGLLIHYPGAQGGEHNRRVAVVVMMVSLAANIVTLHRSIWVCTVGSLIVASVLVRRPDRATMMRWMAVTVMSIGVFVLILNLFLPSSFDLQGLLSKRVDSIFEDPSVPGQSYYTRLAGARTELAAWRDGNPLLGRGLGFWEYDEYRAIGGAAPRHNSYLFYLVNTGLIGLLVFIWVLVFFFRRSLALYRLDCSPVANWVAWTALMTTVYFSMIAMASFPFHNERATPVLGLLFGLVSVCERTAEPQSEPEGWISLSALGVSRRKLVEEKCDD